MAKRVAKFYKVSFEQFKKDFLDCFTTEDMKSLGILPQGFNDPDPSAVDNAIKKIYCNISLPKRSTKGSAGYDFVSPIDLEIKPGMTIKIPTGIRCRIDEDWVLMIYPRSGLGFKFRLQLNNTVGVIDADYFNAENEGHIMAKLTNDTNEGKTVVLKAGKGFCQGIFTEYGITEDDEADGVRVGGFGSTDNK